MRNWFVAPAQALGALALLASLATSQAAEIYAPTAIGPSPRFSDLGADGGWRTFDDFTPATAASAERIGWRGFWVDLSQPLPAPAVAPDALGWDIAFHADAGGTPGALLVQRSVAAADVHTMLVGSGLFVLGNASFNVDLYDYSFDLPAGLSLSSGSTYWVSVMAQSPLLMPAFAWSAATGGNDRSFQQQLDANGQPIGDTIVARDRAVRIEGTLLVAEPAALSLAALAVMLLAALRRGGWRSGPPAS